MSQSSKPPPLPEDGKRLFNCGDFSSTRPVDGEEPIYTKKSCRNKEEWQYGHDCKVCERYAANVKIVELYEACGTKADAVEARPLPSQREMFEKGWTIRGVRRRTEEEMQTLARENEEAVAKVKDAFFKKWNDHVD